MNTNSVVHPLAQRDCFRSVSSTNCQYVGLSVTGTKPQQASVSNPSRRYF
jgi:hypothetical protein